MIVQELKELIKSYMKENDSRTTQAFAKKSKVSYSVVRRILQEEVNQVSLEATLSILGLVASREKTVIFIKKHFPRVASLVEANSNNASADTDETLYSSVLNYEDFSVLALACGKPNGVQEKELVELLGKRSLEIAAKLESLEVIHRNSYGNLVGKVKKFYNQDLTAAATKMSFCNRHLKKELIGENKQFAGVLTEGVSADGQGKLYDLYIKFYHEVSKVLEENPGDKVVFANLALGEIG